MPKKQIHTKRQIQFYSIFTVCCLSVVVAASLLAASGDGDIVPKDVIGSTSGTDSSGSGTSGSTSDSTSGAVVPPTDTQTNTPPAPSIQIYISKPQNNSELSGNITLEAKSSYPLEGLSFYFDNPSSVVSPDKTYVGTKVGNDGALWQYSLNTKELTNGNYYLLANGFLNGVYYRVLEPPQVRIANTEIIDFTLLQPSQGVISGGVTLLIETSAILDSAVFEISGPTTQSYPAIIDGRYVKIFWDTKILQNGDYKVQLSGKRFSQYYKSSVYIFSIKNESNVSPPASETTDIPPEEGREADIAIQPLQIQFVSPTSLGVSGNVRIEAITTGSADQMIFIIKGENTFHEFEAKKELASYIGYLDSTKFPRGSYVIFARAFAGGKIYESSPLGIVIDNTVFVPEAHESIPTVRFVYPQSRAILSGFSTFVVSADNQRLQSVNIRVARSGREVILENAVYDRSNNTWAITWDTRILPNETYQIQATALLDGKYFSSEYSEIQIRNVIENLEEKSEPLIQKETRDEKVTEDLKKVAPNTQELIDTMGSDQKPELSQETVECYSHGISDPEECRQYFSKKLGVHQDCVRFNITDSSQCKEFLLLPSDCRDEGVITVQACKRFIFSKYSDSNYTSSGKPSDCASLDGKKCQELVEKKYFPKECSDSGINDPVLCQKFINQKHFPVECIQEKAYESRECNEVIREKYFKVECDRQRIQTDKECFDYMFERYASKIECSGLDAISCKEVILRRYMGAGSKKIKESEQIQSVIEPFINTQITLRPKISLPQIDTISDIKNIEDITPIIISKETNVLILPARGGVVFSGDEKVSGGSYGIIVYDSDADGLSDEMEKRLGTDAKNSDTDKDGYADGQEAMHQFDPAGSGPMKTHLDPIEVAIVNKATFEHPKFQGNLTDDFKIEKVENIFEPASVDENNDGRQNTFQRISGKGIPGQIIALYIYSDLPLLITTQVDQYGNWQYVLRESLRDGEHELYVTINDNTGKVLSKSKPYGFFVKEAKAVTAQEFFVENLSARSSSWDNVKIYLFLAGAAMLIGIVLFVIFLLKGGKQDYLR